MHNFRSGRDCRSTELVSGRGASALDWRHVRGCARSRIAVTAREAPATAAEALATIPFFAPLSPVDLAKLAGVLEDQWFDAGSEVFEAGGKGDALYIMR